MNIILDNIAIWQPVLTTGLSVLKTAAGVKYQKTGTNLLAITDKPLYRYAKNYTTKGKSPVRYSLFVRTYSDDERGVENQLDKLASGLEKEYVVSSIAGATMQSFVYTNNYLEEAK